MLVSTHGYKWWEGELRVYRGWNSGHLADVDDPHHRGQDPERSLRPDIGS